MKGQLHYKMKRLMDTMKADIIMTDYGTGIIELILLYRTNLLYLLSILGKDSTVHQAPVLHVRPKMTLSQTGPSST